MGVTQGKFLSRVNWFEFRFFLLLDWLPNKGGRTQSALLFNHG